MADPKEVHSASNHETTERNSNTVLNDGFGISGTPGRGEVSVAAGHRTDENPGGYAGGSPQHTRQGQHPSSSWVDTHYLSEQPRTGFHNPEAEIRHRTNTNLRHNDLRTNKKTKANITLATLNVQGRGSNSIFDENHKWHAISRMILTQKIGVLCAQETHLTGNQTHEINELHRNIKVFSSIDPSNPNSKGVAIALNKKITNTQNAKVTEIIPGRALLLELQWHNTEVITILNIYAPNEAHENKIFWHKLRTEWTINNLQLPFPDIMLGDFNITEDTIDRSNGQLDPIGTTNALADLKNTFKLVDGWRQTYPHEKIYTLQHRSNSHRSRLDRIYMSPTILELAEDWKITYPTIISDHKIVSVKIAHHEAPHIGKGRWAFPHHLANNRQLLQDIEKKGAELLAKAIELKNGEKERSEEYNIQTLWTEWKSYATSKAREKAKKKLSYTDKLEKSLEKQIKDLNNDGTEETQEKRDLIAELEQRRAEIEKEKALSRKKISTAQFRLQGETISNYWIKMNKEAKPRDTLKKLKKIDSQLPSLTDQSNYETHSDKMANLAKEYHHNLQQHGIDTSEPQELRDIKLQSITNLNLPTLPNKEKAILAHKITPEEIDEALSSTANGKAAGLDGITYEVYKNLRERNKNLLKESRQGFDVIKMMSLLFNDIAENGLTNNSDLNKGWMCPIYKKNDKADIANYRPITVLNTDYKLMAKTLQAKLAQAAPRIIHKDQAGFMKGRSIFDHIKTIQAVTEYAENIEEEDWNGLIVALDQEKAYDKIRHDYLWVILHKLNLPNRFIKTIQEMYKGATTQVMINGFLSDPFVVSRGVRQGDPLSCLLFNLAIEPLAQMIRESSLEGLKIPNLNDKLKTLLFADDTTVFLSCRDSYDELISILDNWCQAAGAKFNKNKTVIIPFGEKEYQNMVRMEKRINHNGDRLPDNVKINAEGEPTRILGAWFGNENSTQPWTHILDKTAIKLDNWKKSSPTIEGTRLINWMETMSSSQFLTKAQGMPIEIEEKFVKMIKELTWNSPKAKINMDIMYQPLRRGGRRIPDIKSRNLAIDITDLQNFLDQENKRTWTYLLEDNMRRAWDENAYRQENDPRINPLLQKWPQAKSKKKLIKMSKKILQTAKKTNLRIEVDQASEDLKKQMPIWFHPKLKQNIKKENNTRKSKHLRKGHGIQTVGDTLKLALMAEHEARKISNGCPCDDCYEEELKAGCINLDDCIKHAKKLIDQILPDWKPLMGHTIKLPQRKVTIKIPGSDRNDPKDEAQIITKRTRTNSKSEIFRILRQYDYKRQGANYNQPTRNPIPHSVVEIAFTDGSCDNNGSNDAISGSGVHYPANPSKDIAARVPGSDHSNQIGELYAITLAVRNSDPDKNLIIITDSDYAIKSLTSRLRNHEDNGWTGVKNHNWIKEALNAIRMKTGDVALKWTKAHVGNRGNETADYLAKQGTKKPSIEGPQNNLPGRITGLNLHNIKQSTAYHAILQEKICPERPKVLANIERIQNDMSSGISKRAPSKEDIWKNLKQSKNIYRTQREFLFKIIKNILKTGSYWLHLPGLEERAICQNCNEVETIEHILTSCAIPGQKEAWEEAERIWKLKYKDWSKPSIGEIMGCASARLIGSKNKVCPGKSRLYQILISETAYKIWSIRCKRVIGDENAREKWPRPQQIKHSIKKQLELRLRIDCLQANEVIFKDKALSHSKVAATWNGIINHEPDMTPNWMSNPGVLVGIR